MHSSMRATPFPLSRGTGRKPRGSSTTSSCVTSTKDLRTFGTSRTRRTRSSPPSRSRGNSRTYRPYRPKRRTRATDAKEKGLEGLAAILMMQYTDKPMEVEAEAYLSEEKGVTDVKAALQGAMDIVAESVSDSADYRNYIRGLTFKKGVLFSEGKSKSEEPTVYDMYKAFSSPVEKMSGYRVLAVNRGENEKVLSVRIEAPEEDILRYLEKHAVP